MPLAPTVTPPRICVLTTAWNQVEKTIACLNSVCAQDYENLSIILVDNASEDDTISRVAALFPAVEILRAQRNLGFSGGYNLGLRHALADGYDYVCLINNDTLLAENCVKELLVEAERDHGTGLVTAKIYDNAEDRRHVWTVGGRFNRWTLEIVDRGDKQVDVGQWEHPRDIDFAPLCGVLIKRALLEEVGLLDERFFLYYEDMDFCRRARSAGFKLRLAPKATMWHDVSASSGGRKSPAVWYWMARSSVLFFRKHAIGLRRPIVFFWRSGSALRTTLRLVRQRDRESLGAYWRGLYDGVRESTE